MGDRDRGVGVEQQVGHRFADGVGPPDHDGGLARQIGADRPCDQISAAVGRAGHETAVPKAAEQAAGIDEVKSVHILVRVDRLDHGALVDLAGQWQLHQNAVDRRIGIQVGDQ